MTLKTAVKRVIVIGIGVFIIGIGITMMAVAYQNHRYVASIKATEDREYPELYGYFEVESCDGKECKGTFVESRADGEFPVSIGNVRLKTSLKYEQGYHVSTYTTNRLGALCQNFSCHAMPEDENNWVYFQK